MAIKSQADQRKGAKYTDQHGRKWWASIEIRTGDPCSPIEPSFTAPILAPQMYIKLDPDTPGRITIAYDEWERDLVAADRDWVRRCHETGVELYKDAFDPNAKFNVAILNRIGARPHVPDLVTPLALDPIPGAAALPVQACKVGNLWALGLKGPNGEEPRMPERLHDFFVRVVPPAPTFENEFVVDTFEDAGEPEEPEALPTFLQPKPKYA